MRNIVLLVLLSFIIACNSKSAAKEDLITGTWVFVKMEKNGEPSEDEEEFKEMKSIFANDGTFEAIRGGSIRPGKYKFANDGKYIITQMNSQSGWDTATIVELTDKVFRLETEDKEIITLRKQ